MVFSTFGIALGYRCRALGIVSMSKTAKLVHVLIWVGN